MKDNLARVSFVHSISPAVLLVLIIFLDASNSTEWSSLTFPCDGEGASHAAFDSLEEVLSVWPLSVGRSAR